MGRVAGLAARLTPAPSPLARELNRFMRFMSIWALGLGVFIAGASLALGYPFMDTIIFVIGIIVANIPEGKDYLSYFVAPFMNQSIAKANHKPLGK